MTLPSQKEMEWIISEWNLIQQKKSELPRTKRDQIEALVRLFTEQKLIEVNFSEKNITKPEFKPSKTK